MPAIYTYVRICTHPQSDCMPLGIMYILIVHTYISGKALLPAYETITVYYHSHYGAIIVNSPASPLPIELVATTENV